MSIISRFKESQIGQFWLKHEQKIVLTIGIILIAAVSFEAGFLHGQKNKQEPVVVNKVANIEAAPSNECIVPTATETKNSSANTATNASTESIAVTDNQKCAFVASKNSNKYHLPTCQFAQKIKPENKICFSSKEEAESRGFQGAKCCIK
jgi:hypothetical protein